MATAGEAVTVEAEAAERVVRAFTDAVTARDLDSALEFCHPEIEFFSLLAELQAKPYRAPDGRVAIVMSTHMRGKGSGLPLVQRVAVLWHFKDEKLWRATIHRDPADALRATRTPPHEK